MAHNPRTPNVWRQFWLFCHTSQGWVLSITIKIFTKISSVISLKYFFFPRVVEISVFSSVLWLNLFNCSIDYYICPWWKETNLYLLNLSSDPYYDMDFLCSHCISHKFSEMVDLSVFIHPCTFFPIQDSVRGEKGGGESRGKQHGGKILSCLPSLIKPTVYPWLYTWCLDMLSHVIWW